MHCPSCFFICEAWESGFQLSAGQVTQTGLADFRKRCREAIFALSVISLKTAETAIDVAEQAVDAMQSRTLRRGCDGYQAPLAPCVGAANVNDQAMAIVGVLDIDQQGFRLGQAKRRGQFNPRTQKRIRISQSIAQVSHCLRCPGMRASLN